LTYSGEDDQHRPRKTTYLIDSKFPLPFFKNIYANLENNFAMKAHYFSYKWNWNIEYGV